MWDARVDVPAHDFDMGRMHGVLEEFGDPSDATGDSHARRMGDRHGDAMARVAQLQVLSIKSSALILFERCRLYSLP